MRIYREKDYDAMSRRAAAIIAAQVVAKPDCVLGLAPDHDQSYRYFMQDNLFNHVDIEGANTNVPSGLAADPAEECRQYEQKVAELGYADLQLLAPMVCTWIPWVQAFSRRSHSSRDPQPGGQLQRFPYWPQELPAHMSRTSGLHAIALGSRGDQAEKPASRASRARVSYEIIVFLRK